ncbi:MAG: hypothetical protein JXA30_04890 [Deltaproteobacteria bacterium]|nr:hypothetical protein [Deltaproteobacteria bacterium]
MKTLSLFNRIFLVLLFIGCEIDPCDDTKRVEKQGTIAAATPSFDLETPDADKDCHAKFLVTYHWANAKRRIDPNAPDPVSPAGKINLFIVLNTVIGTFGPLPNVQKVEDSSGLDTSYRWVGKLDIGAKNEAYNPVHFRINAYASNIGNLEIPAGEDADYYDVEIDATIEYTVYSAEK